MRKLLPISIIFIALLNVSCSRQDTLYKALESDNAQKVTQLIKQGVNLNKEDSQRRTPLMIASEHGNLEIVNLLLQSGANINATNSSVHWTALMSAVIDGNVDVVRTLLAAGANANAVIEYQKGHIIKSRFSDGSSVLMLAVQDRRVDIVKELLAAGVDVNVKNKNGWTALKFAESSYSRYPSQSETEYYNEMQEIIKLLKAAGAKE